MKRPEKPFVAPLQGHLEYFKELEDYCDYLEGEFLDNEKEISYNEGYDSGVDAGYESGYDEGYDRGYDQGVLDGRDQKEEEILNVQR